MELTALPTIRVAAADLNGQMRGKRMAGAGADKIAAGLRMPLSALNVDVTGADIEGSPLLFETGDADGILKPTGRGPVPMPWLSGRTALEPLWMFHENGAPFAGDPRHALAGVSARLAARGLTAQAAVEMEFYLIDDADTALAPPASPLSGRRLSTSAVLDLRQLDAFDAFFTDLYEAAGAMGIPAEAAISESGLGQFEVTLHHQDALRAADDAWLFKVLVRGLARRHGMAASFMAKPFADQPGNGMHVHVSIWDGDGRNIFDDGAPQGTEALRHAVAGCLGSMAGATLIFAPHANSYTRLVPGAHAPTGAAWAYENRTAAIRIPGGPASARRIEHRVAGGDVNPYLLLTVILGSILTGLEDAAPPPAPITGNAYELDLPGLAADWESAIAGFESDPVMARIFPAELIANLAMTKRQELALFAGVPAERHWTYLLETV
ncbi:glutamine synthetase family protein [Poseidonocella sedimentorum]|uniref:Glutamate--putrescine ligase n=1 Tax=Poseidonocella sedimentorum TaxID=871652 RepID=A0A1I6CXP6_9RHOB|nr:glutamine synthetase family protein [Poseidonocella sedimentorum]SFQ97877.1 glutamate--putrescine ligase [Poseidonocella sedimentorum]